MDKYNKTESTYEPTKGQAVQTESYWIKLANLSQSAVSASWIWTRLEVRDMRFGKEKVEKSPKHEKLQFALSDILYTISPTLVILFSCLFNTSFYLV